MSEKYTVTICRDIFRDMFIRILGTLVLGNVPDYLV
jgi:hypothetical protein